MALELEPHIKSCDKVSAKQYRLCLGILQVYLPETCIGVVIDLDSHGTH